MSGSVASTIQGEGGNSRADMFAVAATIWNRMKSGNFPGGSDPYGIVNAPLQYVAPVTAPSAFATELANAIQNGTLPQYGDVGNAVNFQSGQTAVNSGLTQGGTNIGGNYFSDRLGSPTSSYRPPVYGGTSSASTATGTGGAGADGAANPTSNDGGGFTNAQSIAQ